MDVIVNLPKSKEFVVDQFFKYATFVLATKDNPTEEVAKLFIK